MPRVSLNWIFYFLLSFAVTFVIGFFVWSAFVDFPGNIVRRVLTASVSGPVYQAQNSPDSENASVFESQNIEVVPEALTQESLQDQLDDIQEKLDIISAQVQELVAQQNPDNQVAKSDKDKKSDDQNQDQNNQDQNQNNNQNENNPEIVSCAGQININTASAEDLDKITEVGPATAQKIIAGRPFYSLNDLLKVSGIGQITLQKIIEQGCAYVEPGLVPTVSAGGGGGGGGGGAPAPVVYLKILISEVKIAEKTGDKNIFIELYSPNGSATDLSGWYILRNGSSFITKTMLSGKTIPGNSYFLLTKQGSAWDSQADSSFDGTLNDNDEIILKNPNEDPADQTSWSQIPAGESWCYDFQLCSPTPKLPNIAFIAPPAPTLASIAITTPATKLVYNVDDALDITGLVVTGTYSDASTQVETITPADVTGFDSSAPAAGQILTITFGGQTTTYTVDIVAQTDNSGATQLKIITSPQTIATNTPSGVFTVESQNSSGQLTDVLATTHVSLSSDSPTGMFSSKSATECGADWTKTSITISKGDAHKSFCYQDSTSGTYTITVSATGLSSDSQTVIVSP